MSKSRIAKITLAAGVLAIGWLLDINGIRTSGDRQPAAENRTVVEASAGELTAVAAPPAPVAGAGASAASPAPASRQSADVKRARSAPGGAAVQEIRRDGEYDGKDEVAAYVRKFNGALPRNFITKNQARELGWQGGPLEPFAPGKSIGGDHFGNYEHRLPDAKYKECDIGTRGKPRGTKRLIFTRDGKVIYYTPDHYETFEEIPAP